MPNLSDKQEMFCLEYLKDLNATQAAIRAGYSEKTAKEQGSRLFTNVDIQERIAELKAERCERVKIDAAWVLEQAQRVYNRCMETEPVTDREGNETGVYKFEHSGANKALEIIGKHVDVQAFKERTESTVTHKVDKTLADRLVGGSKR